MRDRDPPSDEESRAALEKAAEQAKRLRCPMPGCKFSAPSQAARCPDHNKLVQ